MEKKLRKFLSNIWFIHFLVLLGIFSLIGYITNNNNFMILFVVLSFSGAICGAFIKVIDIIKETKK